MKNMISLWLLALLALPSLLLAAIKPGAPAPQIEVQAATGPAYVFPLKGAVEEVQLMFLRRALKEAEKAGAAAFIIDMDTPGGRLDVTMDILELLRKTTVPTITFINPSAGSAGALISLGTKKIFMRKDAVIGAAAVVTGEGADLQKSMKDKVDSFYTAKMRAVAEENGHNPDIAEAFMITEKELKIGGTVLDGKETLLSLNGNEATRILDGKAVLAAGLAETVEALMKDQGITGALTRVEATGFETTALWLTRISSLLLLCAIVGAYIEMKAPGFGIPGIVSLICFALFFLGHYIAALSGYEATIVFVIGALLVVVEIFVMPGTIVPGMVGAMLVLTSVLWAMVDHWPSQPGTLGAVDFEKPMLNLLIAIGGAAIVSGVLARILPHTAFYRRLVLAGAPSGSESPLADLVVKLGEVGTASTTLRPAGKAIFAGEIVDVMSDGAFIEAGATVRVVTREGAKVIVELVA